MSGFTWPGQHNGTNTNMTYHNILQRLDARSTTELQDEHNNHASTAVSIALSAMAAIVIIIALTGSFIYYRRYAVKKLKVKNTEDLERTIETVGAKQAIHGNPISGTLREDQHFKGDLSGRSEAQNECKTAHFTRDRGDSLSSFVDVDLADVPDMRRIEV
ncbi:Nn.00g028740.m01.CDS01 [Neocucurbitaria sp. VM-36]